MAVLYKSFGLKGSCGPAGYRTGFWHLWKAVGSGYPETTAWESGRRRTARWTAHRSNQGLWFLSAFFRA